MLRDYCQQILALYNHLYIVNKYIKCLNAWYEYSFVICDGLYSAYMQYSCLLYKQGYVFNIF